jgi:hypothetical protein
MRLIVPKDDPSTELRVVLSERSESKDDDAIVKGRIQDGDFCDAAAPEPVTKRLTGCLDITS